MRAAQFSEFGGPEVLKVVDLPDPEPAAGQIRVKVHAAGINPIDWKVRRGFMGGDLPRPRVARWPAWSTSSVTG